MARTVWATLVVIIETSADESDGKGAFLRDRWFGTFTRRVWRLYCDALLDDSRAQELRHALRDIAQGTQSTGGTNKPHGAQLMQSQQCKKKPKRQSRQRRSGSVVSIGEGRYRIGYNVSLPGEKRRQRFEVIRGDKKTADGVLQQRLVAARKGTFVDSDAHVTFEQLAQQFLDAKRIEKERCSQSNPETSVHT